MDNKTIFVVTLKGEGEIKNHTRHLPEDVKRALALVDDESTVEKLIKRAAPSLRDKLPEMLQRLADGGFIQDKAQAKSGNVIKMATPKMSIPAKKVESEGEELDFTSIMRAPTPESMAVEAAKAKAQVEAEAKARAEAKAKQEAEAARLKAEQEAAKARAEAEAVRIKAEREAAAAKVQLEAAKAKVEVDARARAEAEAKAKQEAEAARLKAEQEAAKARAEAEAVRIKAEREAAAARAQLEAARARAEAEAMARAEAEAKVKQEAEAARLKAEQEAAKLRAEMEAARIKAEQDAAKAKADAEAARLEAERARAEAEAMRIKAVREAAEAEAKLKQEVEAARIKAEQDAAKAKAQADAEAKARQEAEAALVKAELEAAKVKSEAEAMARAEAEAKAKREADSARLKAEQDAARIKSEAEEQARQADAAKALSEVAIAAKVKADAASTRSTIATVLFFDVVGYTKQSVSKQIELKGQFNKLVSEFIKDIDESQRIILDTGDGAAIGFLQHPEDAIEVAMQFRQAVTANKHQDYPELKVRMGIHLGPVNIVKDMNGQSNMVGDGINDAQRIMSFAKADHIYISRPYHDVVSRLTAEYANLFKYRGVEKDKHGREHQVYEVTGGEIEVIEQPKAQQESTPFAINLEPFALNSLDKPVAAPAKAGKVTTVQEEAKAASQAEKVVQKTPEEIEAEAEAAVELKAQQEAETARTHAEQEAARVKAEEAEREMAEEQAKVWAEAEQRAKALATAEEQTRAEDKEQAGQMPQVKAVPRVAKARGKPLPWGKMAAGLVALSLLLVAVLPYVWPMQDYAANIENQMSAQLRQPVHIGHLKGALLPSPKLELQDVSVGDAQELKAANVVLNLGFSALFSEVKAISKLEIDGLTINANSFDKAMGWLQAAGGDAHHPIAQMALRNASISGDGLSLPSVNGSADLDAQGHFTKVVLGSENGKFGIELKPQQSRWQIVLNLKESSLPLLPGIPLNEFNAKGVVDEGAARFNEIDGRLYGGTMMGNANLTWQNGWKIQGHITVKTVELQNALPQFGVSGEMEGDVSFTMAGTKLQQLNNVLNLDGSFVVKKGIINNIDMVETASSGSRNEATGGRTHFDELSVVLQADNSGQHLRQVKISAGVMSANGSVDVNPAKQLSGRLSVDLKMRAGLGSVPLSLSGTAGKPALRVVR